MTLADLTSSSPLPYLGPHLPILAISTVTCFAIQHLAHIVTPQLLGKKWDGFDAKTKRGWASHCVSLIEAMTHALVVVPLALRSLWLGVLKDDLVFGYDPVVGDLLALSSGYFIWDTLDSALNSTIGFVIHGACCLAVYLFSFRPFLAGFGSSFLLWEMSTVFLNIYWFMDKTKLSTSYPKVFLLNQLTFMSVFFGARILFGGYQSIAVINTMYANRDRIPLYMFLIYGSGNIALNGLNCLWFSKMVKQMIAKLQGGKKREELKKEKKEEGSLSLPVAPASPVVTKREL